MTLELFTHQYNILKRLYWKYESLVLDPFTYAPAAREAFNNCTRINHLLFDLHVKYNEQ